MSVTDQTWEQLRQEMLAWPLCPRCKERTPRLRRGHCSACYAKMIRTRELKPLVELQPEKTACEVVADFLACAERGRDLVGLAEALGYTPDALAQRLRRYVRLLDAHVALTRRNTRNMCTVSDLMAEE